MSDVSHYERNGRVRPVTKRELDTFPGLAATLEAQGWNKITARQAEKTAEASATNKEV